MTWVQWIGGTWEEKGKSRNHNGQWNVCHWSTQYDTGLRDLIIPLQMRRESSVLCSTSRFRR